MPPRRSGRVAAAAEQRAWAFPQLPLECVLRIFSLLPADQRLRYAEVSRGWRATLALPALWERLDLSDTSGVALPVSPALLRAALARAGGALTALHVRWTNDDADTLCAALRASRALVELRLLSADDAELPHPVAFVTALLAGLPRLRELHAGASCTPVEAVGLLEGSPPFAPLRLHALAVSDTDGDAWPPTFARALADAALQPELARLWAQNVALDELPGVMDVLAIALVSRCSLRSFRLFHSALSPAEEPALARMLRDGALADVHFHNVLLDVGEEEEEPALADALRASGALTSLALVDTYIPAPTMLAVLGALAGHRSLRKLNLSYTFLEDSAAVGAALGALLAADAPPLTELFLKRCHLGEAGLGPLCDALPHNAHLLTLDICSNRTHAGFVRDRLLPAVRGNTSLRTLLLSSSFGDDAAEVDEVMRIVEARGRAP